MIHDASRIQSPSALAEAIVNKCLTAYLDPINNTDEEKQVLELYNKAIGKLADAEASRFQQFSDQVKLERESTHESKQQELDISEDITLLEQIKDIRDELNIFLVIFSDQEKVLGDLCKFRLWKDQILSSASPPDGEQYLFYSSQRITRAYIAEVKRMDKRAEETSKALKDLLDLKQKQANVKEARWAREQAFEATRQGNTLVFFTLVTIVFSPLSFMAAFLAIDIKEFPKTNGDMDLDFVLKYIFSISAAIVLPLVLLAFTVNDLTRIAGQFGRWVVHRCRAVASPFLSNRDPLRPVDDDKRKSDKHLSPEPTSASSKLEAGPPEGRTREKDTSTAEENGAGNNATDQSQQVVLYVLSFIFVILLDEEVYFAFRILPRHIKKLATDDKETSVEAKDEPHGGKEGYPTISTTGSITPVDVSAQPWLVRDRVKDVAFIAAAILRLGALPVWIAILAVDLVLLLGSYAIAALLFKESPLQRKSEELATNVYRKVRGRD